MNPASTSDSSLPAPFCLPMQCMIINTPLLFFFLALTGTHTDRYQSTPSSHSLIIMIKELGTERRRRWEMKGCFREKQPARAKLNRGMKLVKYSWARDRRAERKETKRPSAALLERACVKQRVLALIIGSPSLEASYQTCSFICSVSWSLQLISIDKSTLQQDICIQMMGSWKVESINNLL